MSENVKKLPPDVHAKLHVLSLGMAIGQILSSDHLPKDYEQVIKALSADDEEAIEDLDIYAWQPFEDENNPRLAELILDAAGILMNDLAYTYFIGREPAETQSAQPKTSEQIIDVAQDAFWAVIAKHHPECKTGDLDPMSMLTFDNVCRQVVDTWVDANKPNSAKQGKGVLLHAEPSIDAIVETHWDCWADDGDTQNPQYKWTDPRAISIAYVSLTQWSEQLGIPGIHPSILSKAPNTFWDWYLSAGQHSEGYANVFRQVIDKIIEAGYAVYVSDTRLEVYRMADLIQADLLNS